MKTKAQVTAEAKKTLKQMKTKGWEIRVHENLGWHWCLENVGGHFCIHGEDNCYWTLLSDGDYAHTGSVDWNARKEFSDPNRAVDHQLTLAREHRDKISAWINQVEDALS